MRIKQYNKDSSSFTQAVLDFCITLAELQCTSVTHTTKIVPYG